MKQTNQDTKRCLLIDEAMALGVEWASVGRGRPGRKEAATASDRHQGNVSPPLCHHTNTPTQTRAADFRASSSVHIVEFDNTQPSI